MNAFTRWTRSQPWLLWTSLGCALVSTASAEYSLALATGMNPVVAGAVPGALDAYVVQALRTNRDVLPAVLTAVAVNVTSHLVHAGDLPMNWIIRSAVGSITALLLWRVHYLWRKRTHYPEIEEHPKERRSRRWFRRSRPAPEGAPDPLPEWERDLLAESGREHPREHRDRFEEQQAATWPVAPLPYPDPPLFVPEPWTEELEPGAVSAPAPEDAPEVLLDDLVVHPEALLPGDHDHLGSLSAYLLDCVEESRMPSARGCKAFCNVGWERAKRLMAAAGLPSKEEEQ